MAITFGSENYGDIRIQDVMIDVDGTNLEEGIDIISMDDMFEYSDITNELFHKAIDSLKISNWKKQFLKNNCTIYGKGRHRGHYYHEKCCEHIIEVENQYRSEYPNIENFIDECEIEIMDFIIQEYESLARTLYKDLMAVYEYLTLDECVAYALIAHEYEFLENGKRV